MGGFQYKNAVLEFFPTAEGYVKNDNGVYSYVFQYKDHLGNVRLSYAKNASNVLEIIEENNYYPFGLQHKGYNIAAASTNQAGKYKYNGKELQDELQLNLYAYGHRYYDPAVGRWTTMDPLINDLDFKFDPYTIDTNDKNEVAFAMKTTLGNGGGIFNTDNLNPYSYGYNDPVRFEDPDGRCPICVFVIAALVFSEFANAPTGNAKVDGRNYNASKSNKTLVSKAVLAGGTKTVLGSLINSTKATPKTKAEILKENVAKGKKFEQKVVKDLKEKGHENVQEQVTIKPLGGDKDTKNVKLDVLSTENNATVLTEAKSSETAPLTPAQKEGFPLIEQNGGVIMGQGKPGYEGGTIIPPTKVNVVRP